MRRTRRQQDGGGPRRVAHPAVFGLLALMALAWLLTGEVRPAAAFHYENEGLGCYACHTLDEAEGEPNTSYIQRTSRTLLDMKSANGGTVPGQFGCTYCHNIGTRAKMKAVLTHFSGKASMHPVGQNFVSGGDTNGEYLSTWGSAANDELDCVDCHQVTGAYPEHGPPPDPVNNPYMLRNVTAANQYDPLCRTCHGNSAAPVNGIDDADHRVQLTATSPHTDGDAGGSGPIVESDGTQLRTTAAGGDDQCRKCHDSHYSSRQRLFNDGHELVGGTATPETPIDISNCTGTCHFAGDQYDNFNSHGHGKTTAISGGPLAFNCTNCHSVDALHNSTFPPADPRAAKMLSATPDTAVSTLTGKSLESVCTTCHNNFTAHQGTVGCLDCHDEHAEGSGATSNIYMIPQQLPNRTSGGTEAVVFEHLATGDYDYYIDDSAAPHQAGAGLCDNGVCHSGLVSSNGTPLSPLSTLMTGSNHTGSGQTALSDCTTCHKHDDAAGSMGASATCTSCHGQPPVSLQTQVGTYLQHVESYTPHARHANSPSAATNPGYDFACQMCHSQWTNGATHDTGDEVYGYTYESVWFDTAFNPLAAPYPGNPLSTPNYNTASNTCSSIYCHSDGSSGDAVGTAVWMTGQMAPNWGTTDLACDACHGDGDGDGAGRSYPLDAMGNHARHVGKNVGCQNCHGGTTADGTSITLANGLHVNRVKDVIQGGVYPPATVNAVAFGWDGGTKTCSAVSCHSGQSFTAAPILWTTAGGSCTVCHNNGINDGALANSWPLQGEHQIHAGAQPAAQGYVCTRCHPDNGDGSHETLDKTTTVTFDGNFVPGGTFDNDGFNDTVGTPEDGDNNLCSATYCHGSNATWSVDWDSSGAVNGNGILRNASGGSMALTCDGCHGTAGLGTGRPNSPATGGRHTGTAHQATACTACHLNDNADRTLHAQGPAQAAPLRSDAAMAAAVDGAAYWREFGAVAGAPDQGFAWVTGTCGDMTTGCHPAASWGQVAGCALCHGDRAAGTFWPDGAVPGWPDTNPAPPARAAYYFDDDAGSHGSHIAALQAKEGFTTSQAHQTAMCAYCHPSPGSAAHRTNQTGVPTDPLNRVDVLNDGYAANAGTYGRIDSTSDQTATADGSVAAAYDGATRTCSASDCHYENPTPSPASIPVYANGWNDGDSLAPNCETCHFARGTIGAGTYPTRAYVPGAAAPAFPDGDLPDAHSVHVSGIASPDPRAGKSYPCSSCHDVTGYTTAHVDGAIEVSPIGAPRFNGDDTITPVSTAVKYGAGVANTTCANLYCHGADFTGAADGTGGTRGTDITPVWNDQTTGTCGTCHDIDTEAGAAWGQELSQGAHGTHMAGKSLIAWGPGLDSHSAGCQVCHGWKPDGSSGTPVGCGTNCHGGVGTTTLLPGGAADAGYAWEPSRSHVEGLYEIDFENRNRGWSDAFADPYTGAGLLANLTTTDICNGCHGTADVGGQVGATVAKTNWPTAARIDNCLLCHAQSAPAWSRAVIGGVAAPAKDQHYAADGHGKTGAYNATLHGQPGPGYPCQICHAENTQHVTGALGQDRLETVPAESPALAYTTAASEFCLACHKVGGTGVTLPDAGGTPTAFDSVAEATVHSGGVKNHFNSPVLAPAAFPAYGQSGNYATNPGYQCAACHDPHGTGKLAMVRATLDGRLGVGGASNPVAVTGFESTDVNFADLDPSTAAGDGVCDACHLAAGDTAAHPDATPPSEGPNGNHFQGGSGVSCMACHNHAESFFGSCARCHGDETTGNIWPDGNPANNSGQNPGNAYADDEPGSHAEHIALLVAMEGFNATLLDEQIAMCAYCHPNPGGVGHEVDTAGSLAGRVDLLNDGVPANAGTYKRIDGTSNKAGAADAHLAGSYAPGTRSCANIDCHYEKPTPVAPAHPTYPNGWDDGDLVTNVPSCTTCHTDGIATYQPGDLPNAHDKHVDEFGDGGYNFACTQCHPTWGSTRHLNGAVDLALDGALGEPGSTPADHTGSDLAVKYGEAGGYATCNALYCHGADTLAFPPTGNGGTDTTPTWNLPSSAACGSCHGRTAAAPPQSNAHIAHAGDTSQVPAGYSLGCNLCHAATTDGTTITNRANHVDFQADISFDGTDARLSTAPPDESVYYGDAAVGSGYGACGNTYCHSDGTDGTKPFTRAAAVPLSWNGPAALCSDCHAAPPAYADGLLVDGAPKANKHGDHAAQGYTECRTCHAGTAADNGAILGTGGYGLHVNTQYDATPYAGNGALNSFAYAGGTCSTTNCHGGSTVAWADPGPFACDACHGVSAGVPVDGDVNNFSMRDWTQSKIDSAGAVNEYDAAGHGSVGKNCDACHDSGVPHDPTNAPLSNNLPGANPFRLDAGFTCSNTATGCHEASPARDVVNHTKANMETAGYNPTQVDAWTFTPDCISCHDPHGDLAAGQASGNLAMIQRELYESAFGIPAGPPPAQPTEQTALAFTSTAGVGSASYAWTTETTPNYSGLCQECHETADADFTAFKDGPPGPPTGSASVSPHPDAGANPGNCVACHPHSEAFRPPGCSGCHGNEAAGSYWPDDSTAHEANDAGRHQKHMEVIAARLAITLPGTGAQQKQICEYCHAAVTNDDDHGSNAHFPAEVFATTVGTVPSRFAKRVWDATADGDAAYDAAAGGTCAATDCHNNKTTTNAAPYDFSWYGNPAPGSASACVMCHADVTNVTGVTPTGTTHVAHLTTTTSAAGGALACASCHEAATDWVTNTPPATGHLGGTFTVGGSVSFTYSGYTYPATKGTCGTNICHNDGKNSLAYNNGQPSYAWGTPIEGVGSCSECHRPSPITQSHGAHLATQTQANGGAVSCASCHGAGAAAAATHANFAVNLGGVTFTYTGGTGVNESPRVDNGSCGTNLCHNNGKNGQPYNGTGAPTYAWGTALGGGTDSCTDCHRDVPVTESHTAHLTTQTRAAGGAIGCASCHGASPATAATHANLAVNFGGVTFTYGGGAAVDESPRVDNGSCGTNLCHNDGKNGQPYNGTGAPAYAWGTALGGGTNSCTDCHLDLMATGSHTAHRTTQTQAAGGAILCATCHGATPHAADAHANSTVNFGGVSFSYGGGTLVGDGSDTGTCGTNACHSRGYTVATVLQDPYNAGAGAYNWGTALGGGTNTCTDCHGSASGDHNATQAHAPHMNAATTFGIATIACSSCHTAATVATHADQTVTIAGPSYTGGTAITEETFGTCGQNSCHNDGAGGAPLNSAYQWDQAYADCTLCHADAPATGNHTDHLTALYGPAFGTDCGACHVANANNTSMASRPKHINGTVEFANVVTTTSPDAVLGLTAPAGAPNATSTDRCNQCHSTAPVTLNGVGAVVGTVLAKTNWDTGSYALPCLTCHNGTDPATDNAAGTVGAGNPAAPDMLGNDSTNLSTGYGFEVRGHGRDTSFQDETGAITNPAANRDCNACHDTAADHLNDADDTAYGQMRLLGTINSQATGSVTAVCNACHTNGAGARATSWVTPHGNTDYTNPQHDPNAEGFAYRCEACHEPHGMTSGGTWANIYMVRTQVGVGESFTTVPGAPADATTTPARFQRIAGANSFDDGLTQTDNVCVTCHTNGARPGSGTDLRNSDGDHSEVAGGFTGNEQGKTCMNCHTHEYDNNTATIDGFMPMSCDTCHSYPGLANAAPKHTLSRIHDIHVNDQADGGYGFLCATCHFAYNHNQSNFTPSQTWDNTTVPPGNINIQFNTAWNPTNQTDYPRYNNQNATTAATTGISTHDGTCTGLYCHGNNAASQTDWAGVAETPSWSTTDVARLTCNSCHDDPPASGAHTLHVIDNDGTDRTDCALCHSAIGGYGAPANTTTDPANHVNLATDVAPAVGYAGQTTAIPPDGYCTGACHASGTADGRWNDTALNCTACHHYKTGDTVGKHGKHTNGAALAMACASCHTAFVDSETPLNPLTHPSMDQVDDAANIQDKAAALESETSVSDAGYNGGTNTFADGADTCSNAWCHNPSALGKTPDWDDPASVIADCTFCHDAVPATGSHTAHFAAEATYGLTAFNGNSCAACHLTVAAGNYDHIAENGTDGNVKFNGTVITTQYTAAAVLPAGATGWGTCAANACHNTGDGVTAPSAYTWGTGAVEPSCALCHAQKPATGAHATHVGTAAAYGPHGAAGTNDCSECHEATTNTPTFTMAAKATHINGTVTFLNRATPATPYEVTSGQIGAAGSDAVDSCDNCHGGATSVNAAPGAKDNWATATRLACGSCHGQSGLAWSAADGTGSQAPDMMGDASTYGSDVTGHSKTVGAYASGNNPAAKACSVCHTDTSAHIDGANGTGFTDHRIQGTINSQAVTAFEEACNACHQSTGIDAGTQVSRHGNSSAGGYTPIEGAFTVDCLVCHEPHGLVAGGGSVNWSMFRYDLQYPAAFSGTRQVAHTARTGADSFDELTGDATNADQKDDVCATCHITDANATTLTRHLTPPAGGGVHEGTSFTGDERGKNCVACHTHDYDGSAASANGFMPESCDSCHSYPGLSGGSPDHVLSGVHNAHVNANDATVPGYAFACETCHYLYNHNQSGYIDGSGWNDAAIAPNVNVRFNTALNPTNQTDYPRYNDQNATTASTVGIGGTGTCAGLYCHGNNQTLQTDWAGVAETPAWDTADPARFACNACHDDPPGSGAHALHVVDNGATDRTDCNACHTSVGSIDAATPMVATHVNGTTAVVNVGYGSETTAIPPDGFCTAACHASGAADGRWSDAALNCDACHYYNTAGDPSAATNTTGSTFRPISETSHNGHFAASGRTWACTDCHTDNTLDASPLPHVTSGTGADSAVIQGRAIPTQGEATIAAATTLWNGIGDWSGTVTKTCANRCHNPSAGAKLSTAWGTTNAAGCEFCHATAAAPATGSHGAHIGATATYGLTIACVSCHPNNGTNDGHLTGTVELANIAGATPYAGALTPPWNATFGACTTTTCHNSGDGTTTVPTQPWGTGIAEPSCGICHAQTPVSGAHGTHLQATAYGPHTTGSTNCGECHEAQATNASMATETRHINSTVTFINLASPGTPYEVTSGQIGDVANDPVDTCNNCHGGPAGANAASGAKDSWAGATRLACGTCHGTYAPARQNADGTGTTAPNTMTYYATANGGHGAVAPAQTCEACHDENGAHIDSTPQNEDRIVQPNVTTFCQYCHDNDATDGVGGESVVEVAATKASTHGNTSGSYTPLWAKENPFSQDCADCHNPHGTSNITMVNTTINAQPVTYTASTQWDTTAGTADVCQVCHTATEHNGDGPSGQHQADYRDTDQCRGCHTHEYDDNEASADGFMPAACDACHSFPGLGNLSDEHQLSPTHDIHVNPQASGGYAFACTACHFGYETTHNASFFADGGNWDAVVTAANIHIRFDTTLNPTNQTDYPRYNDANATTAATTGISTHDGTCAGLYCHGNNQTLQADWAGSAEQPAWDPTANPARYACGACHADAPASGAHALHADADDETDRTDCVLCHAAAGGYGASTNGTTDPANHVNGTTSVGYSYGDGTLLTGFCTGACHASTATGGRWNDASLACDACHYYNVAGDPSAATNTAGTTFRPISENSHDGHFAATGRAFACTDCHTNNASDASPLGHVTPGTGNDAAVLTGKAVPTQSEATIATGSVYWNAAGDWSGNVTKTCANRCHNPSADGHVSTGWGATADSCSFCHNPNVVTPPATGGHPAHLGAAAVYGISAGCTSCHPDHQTGSAYGHMNGTVDLPALASLTYAGGGDLAIPYGAPYGTCSTTTCHQDGKGAAAVSSVWGTPIVDPNCAICHGAPPSAGNDGARHVKHDDNNAWVAADCGACHAANANKTSMAGYATHVDGSVDMGGTGAVSYLGAGDCTNSCHDVVPAAAGDWLDTDALACVDCHAGTHIGTAPASGLHAATTALAHDDSFGASYTCTSCHTAAGPSNEHIAGPDDTATPNNSTVATYSFNTANIPAGGYVNTGYPATTTCQARCHSDYKLADDGGLWRRKWLGVEDAVPADTNNPGDAVCDNCHGDGLNASQLPDLGWNWDEADDSTTDHTDPSGDLDDAMGAQGKHPDCRICHGWGVSGYDRSWNGAAPGHGDGFITMNGPDEAPGGGAGYDDATGGCAAACHDNTPPFSLKTNSGWTANYGDFGVGACETCHDEDGPGPNVMGSGVDVVGENGKPYDDGDWGFNVNGHGANGAASWTPTGLAPNAICDHCHTPGPDHRNGTNEAAVLSEPVSAARPGAASTANPAHLNADYNIVGSFPQEYDVQRNFDQKCFNNNGLGAPCHSSSMSHRHAKDSIPAASVVRFSDKGTILDARGIVGIPIDIHLSSNAPSTAAGAPPYDYVPCISCHNPHGTNTPIEDDINGTPYDTNRMLRYQFVGENPPVAPADLLCNKCHPYTP